MKQRHLHALKAHVELALEYDPQNLEQLTALNTQIREAARKLPGFVDVKFSLGKIPAPVEAIVEPMVPDMKADLALNLTPSEQTNLMQMRSNNADPLAIPAFLARQK